MHTTIAFGQDTPETVIAAFVDEVRRCPERADELAALLPERLPLYGGRSANAVTRIRGYILAAFEQTGLPDDARPYALEALESGRDAYLVAAAAKALRGSRRPADWSVPYLFKAVQNIAYHDDALSFETFAPRWPLLTYTTALDEIWTTFAWLGAEAASALGELEALAVDRETYSARTRATIAETIATIRAASQTGRRAVVGLQPACCCCDEPAPFATSERRAGAAPADIGAIEFEDQDGQRVTFAELFSGRPSIVAFFYTRCDNPNKCSLTITKLAELQRALGAAGMREHAQLAAVTYDPDYDLPRRLRAYGQIRGVIFDERCRFLRSMNGFDRLSNHFELGVSYGQAVVNQHRIELYILDASGVVAGAFTRLQWEIDDVLEQARAFLPAYASSTPI